MASPAASQFGVSTSPSKSELTEAAYRLLDEYGIQWGPNKVTRLVLRYLSRAPNGSMDMFHMFIAAQVQVPHVSPQTPTADRSGPAVIRRGKRQHSDPVGEEAVRNVVQQRGF